MLNFCPVSQPLTVKLTKSTTQLGLAQQARHVLFVFAMLAFESLLKGNL